MRRFTTPRSRAAGAKVAENAQLTRGTTAEILTGIQPSVFEQFKKNPEHFIAEASRIIAEQKATMIIERLDYDAVTERYGVDIFTANQTGQDFSRATAKLRQEKNAKPVFTMPSGQLRPYRIGGAVDAWLMWIIPPKGSGTRRLRHPGKG